MTIDEFMLDIAPKMRPGWVAMDEDKEWFFHKNRPNIIWTWWDSSDDCWLTKIFDIAPVDDWTQSLRKVGK